MTCRTCKGTGKVTDQRQTPNEGLMSYPVRIVTVSCPDCAPLRTMTHDELVEEYIQSNYGGIHPGDLPMARDPERFMTRAEHKERER